MFLTPAAIYFRIFEVAEASAQEPLLVEALEEVRVQFEQADKEAHCCLAPFHLAPLELSSDLLQGFQFVVLMTRKSYHGQLL